MKIIKQSKKVSEAFRAVELAAIHQAEAYASKDREERRYAAAKWETTKALSNFRKVVEANVPKVFPHQPKKAPSQS